MEWENLSTNQDIKAMRELCRSGTAPNSSFPPNPNLHCVFGWMGYPALVDGTSELTSAAEVDELHVASGAAEEARAEALELFHGVGGEAADFGCDSV